MSASGRFWAAAALLWALVFLTLILMGTAHGLLGNTDSMLAVAFGNIELNKLKSLLFGGDPGNSLYPTGPLFWGESSLLLGAFFGLFKVLSHNDFISYSLLLSMIIAGNMASSLLLFRALTDSAFAAMTGSALFSLSPFLLCANIDSLHTICFSPSFLAFYFYLASPAHDQTVARNYGRAASSGALWGLQIYASAYAWAISLLMFPLALWSRPRRLDLKAPLVPFLGSALLVGLPFWCLHLRTMSSKNFFNPYNSASVVAAHSVYLGDFLRPAQNTVFYDRNRDIAVTPEEMDIMRLMPPFFRAPRPISPGISLGEFGYPEPRKILFNHSRKAVWPGVFFPAIVALATTALWRAQKIRLARMCWAFCLLGLMIALGPIVAVYHHKAIWSPTVLAYEHFPILDYFRIPSRMYMLCIFSLSLLAALGADQLTNMRMKSFLTILLVLYAIENAPWKPRIYHTPLAPSREIVELARRLPLAPNESFLDFPSDLGLGFLNDWRDLFQWSREALYMNWQTYHKRNIPNGVQGYLTKPRMELNDITRDINNSSRLAQLRREFGTRYIFVHKGLFLFDYEHGEYERMLHNPALKTVYDSGALHVFHIL